MDGRPPIRVLMVVEKLHGLGGAQKQALRLAGALRPLGVEATIVTGRWRRSEPRHTVVDGIPVKAVFTAFKFFHLRGLRKLGMYIYLVCLFLELLRRRKEYDVLHVHSATVSAYAVALAGRWLRKPTIMKVMASGGWSDFKRMREGGEVPGSAFMARSFLGFDRVVCLNDEAEAECAALGFTARQRFRVPNGFPVREVQPVEGYRSAGEIRLTFAGRLDPQKDPRTLLEAVALLNDDASAPALRLVLLGDGPQRRELEQLVAERGLSSRVELGGRVDDVAAELRRTGIFVLPSLSEGISNALLEAMAHGLPCVATRIPGNLDLIRDRATGLLVPAGDARALAAALRELAGNEELRRGLGLAARAFVEQHFDLATVALRYAELYGELTAERRPLPSPAR